jgi:Neprosin
MSRLEKYLLLVPWVLGVVGVCYLSVPARSRGAVGRNAETWDTYSRGEAKEAVTCVDRPKGIHPPPKRLAPVARPRGRDGGGGNEPYSSAKTESKVSRLGFKAVCPEGQVPVIKERPTKIFKGNPLFGSDPRGEALRLSGRAKAEFLIRNLRSFEEVYKRPRDVGQNPPPDPNAPPCDGIAQDGSCYYYGSAGFATAADGGGMTTTIEKPVYVQGSAGGHSLDEISVQGGDKNGNIIEMGWLVSTDQEGNANPHIFVYHWIDWAGTCYDTCAWHQYSSTYHPGMDLGSAVGNSVYIGYVLYQGNWWGWFDDQWMGYFPGTEWNGAYTKTSLIQWFGEVSSSNGIPPKTQMGDGELPSSPTAAPMITLCDVDAKAWVCWYRDQQSLSSTVPKYYDIARTGFGAVRYGGPGQ